MQMTPEEIRVEYNTAKEKKKQIEILAQLNQCSIQDICAILEDQGIEHRILAMMFAKREKTGGKKKKEPEKETKKTEAGEIAEKFEATEKIVAELLKPTEMDVLALTAEFWQAYVSAICVEPRAEVTIEIGAVEAMMSLYEMAKRCYGI